MDPTIPLITCPPTSKKISLHPFQLNTPYTTTENPTFTNTFTPSQNDGTNPNLSQNIFFNKEAIELANLDAVFDLTKYHGGYIVKQVANQLIYLDLSPNHVGFVEYLQWRITTSFGYGITKLNFLEKAIDTNYYNTTTGFDQSGNLTTNLTSFKNWILSYERMGVDLIVAFNNGNTIDSLFVAQVLIALYLLKDGGTLVIRVHKSNVTVKSLLYILAQTFENVYLFKPFSTNGAKYMVAKVKVKDVRWQTNYLEKILKLLKDNQEVDMFDSYSSAFENWFDRIQNIHAKKYNYTYNYNSCLAFWNLPSFRPKINLLSYEALTKSIGPASNDAPKSITRLDMGGIEMYRLLYPDGSLYVAQVVKNVNAFVKAMDIAKRLNVRVPEMWIKDKDLLSFELLGNGDKIILTEYISDDNLIDSKQVNKKEFVTSMAKVIVFDILCHNPKRFPSLFYPNSVKTISDLVVSEDGLIYAINNVYNETMGNDFYNLENMVINNTFDDTFWQRVVDIFRKESEQTIKDLQHKIIEISKNSMF